jgi:uncharacterized protein YkwD
MSGGPADFVVDVACDRGPGRMQVEIVGDAGRGPEVIANFPLWCGVLPPASVRVAAGGAVAASEAEAESIIVDGINRDRATAGVPPLHVEPRLVDVSRAHSRDMRDQGFVAHVSPARGGPEARARAARLAPPLLLENVAHAYSAVEAHVGLMNSPGHRHNVLHPDATHVGVGVAFGGEVAPGRPELYVTETFAKLPPADPAVALGQARDAITRRRAAAGLPALIADASLDDLAGRAAASWAAGGQPTAVSAGPAGRRYLEVRTLYVSTSDPAAVGQSDAVAAAGPTHMGIGLALGRDRESGAEVSYVVVLLARRR